MFAALVNINNTVNTVSLAETVKLKENSVSTQDLITTQSVFPLTFILDASVLCKKKKSKLLKKYIIAF